MVRSPRWLSAGVMIALLAGCLMISSPAEASVNVSFGFFYSNLSPHGSWLVSAEYGRVWQPYEYDRDWNPYYDGRWAYSDYGWTWVSDYSWGAIPYHYGTWYPDPYYGWVWVPGTVWAPSWVVFRSGPDYIGWCPVPPRYSIGASFRFGSPRYDDFVFVSSRDFTSRRIRGAAIRDHRRGEFINNTRIVNNIRIENNVVVNRGPDVRSVERASGRQVRRYKIEDVARVAPDRDFDRSQFRVDRRGAREFRATEPIPKSRPLPSGESGRDDRRYDRRGDSHDEPRDNPRADRRDDRRNDRSTVPESRRDRRLGRPDAGNREDDRRPDLRSPSSGPEGRAPQREHERSFDRDRREEQQPREYGRGRTGQDRPDVRERDRDRNPRVIREPREDRQPQMRERSQREQQRQRQERPRREDRQRDQRREKPREHKPEQNKPPHGN
jgi:hypothetical protein